MGRMTGGSSFGCGAFGSIDILITTGVVFVIVFVNARYSPPPCSCAPMLRCSRAALYGAWLGRLPRIGLTASYAAPSRNSVPSSK